MKSISSIKYILLLTFILLINTNKFFGMEPKENNFLSQSIDEDMKDDYDDESIHENMSDNYDDESIYENMSDDYNDESFNQGIKNIGLTKEEKLFSCIEENDDCVIYVDNKSIIKTIYDEKCLTEEFFKRIFTKLEKKRIIKHQIDYKNKNKIIGIIILKNKKDKTWIEDIKTKTQQQEIKKKKYLSFSNSEFCTLDDLDIMFSFLQGINCLQNIIGNQNIYTKTNIKISKNTANYQKFIKSVNNINEVIFKIINLLNLRNKNKKNREFLLLTTNKIKSSTNGRKSLKSGIDYLLKFQLLVKKFHLLYNKILNLNEDEVEKEKYKPNKLTIERQNLKENFERKNKKDFENKEDISNNLVNDNQEMINQEQYINLAGVNTYNLKEEEQIFQLKKIKRSNVTFFPNIIMLHTICKKDESLFIESFDELEKKKIVFNEEDDGKIIIIHQSNENYSCLVEKISKTNEIVYKIKSFTKKDKSKDSDKLLNLIKDLYIKYNEILTFNKNKYK